MTLALLRSLSMTLNSLRDQFLKGAITNRLTLQNSFHSLGVPAGISNRLTASGQTPGNCWSLTFVRTNVRDHFPRPNENKRLSRFSFAKRMQTRGGRTVLMKRYLKGRHVLSH